MRLSWVLRLALVVGAGALLMTATVVAVAPRVWRLANAHSERPVELPDFADLAQRSYVYDMSGREIAVFEVQNSQPVALADVPAPVIDAFLAVEDNEFWFHHGVNVRSLFRATLSNFASEGPIQGASTITMQVVKNDYLAGFERDGRYKLLQVTYAVRLEKQKTKQEILERYLNTVFFGQNSYGIGAAAETYFGKPVQQLTFIEAAFLAGLVRAPTSYNPIINPERSRTRFLQVLDRLEADELVTEQERIEVEDSFVLPERVRRRAERATQRTYFTEALRDYLLNRTDILGETYEERYTLLHRGGLSIHATLDPNLQAQAERARNELPSNTVGIDAALTSLDTKTGAIRAMVGGKGFVPGQNEVNLALAPSQTGSSIKLFILAAALQAGATPSDVIDGTHPCVLPNEGNPNEPFFRITGGVNGGIDTLRRHTVRSINCAFARTSQIVGLNRMVDTVYRMAGNPYLYPGQPAEEREPIQPFSAFATGANEMSTLDMAAGIQSIANEGVHHQPYYVDYIDDAFGNRVYTHFDPGVEVLDRQVALTAIDVLKGVLTGGTARAQPVRLRQPSTCVRQDRHPAEQLDGRLRGRHARAVDGGDRARPRPLHPDARHCRVQCRRGASRARWHVPGSDLGGVHGEHRSRTVRVRRLGSSGAATAWPGTAVPAGQRVLVPDRRLRGSRHFGGRGARRSGGFPPPGSSRAERPAPGHRPATDPATGHYVACHAARHHRRRYDADHHAADAATGADLRSGRKRHYDPSRCTRPERPAAIRSTQPSRGPLSLR